MAFNIVPASSSLDAELQAKIDNKTKPLGSLGKLEVLAKKIGLIQKTLEPGIRKPTMLVFAGDHGVTEQGVSPFPSEVTGQMVLNFLSGGAAINVFCQQHDIALKVVDAGVKSELPDHPDLLNLRVASGTADFSQQPAMTPDQFQHALEQGSRLASDVISKGSNCLGFGEMGIGNTTSAAAIMAALTGLRVEQCAGRGTGLDQAGLNHKVDVIKAALELHQYQNLSVPEIFRIFGGLEMAMMAGALLEAAQQQVVVLVDGFIASAVALACVKWFPNCRDYLIFCHQSDEQGHKLMLNYMEVEPLVDLNMRLGEGSGVAVAFPIIQSAVLFLKNMATFESAGVSDRDS